MHFWKWLARGFWCLLLKRGLGFTFSCRFSVQLHTFSYIFTSSCHPPSTFSWSHSYSTVLQCNLEKCEILENKGLEYFGRAWYAIKTLHFTQLYSSERFPSTPSPCAISLKKELKGAPWFSPFVTVLCNTSLLQTHFWKGGGVESISPTPGDDTPWAVAWID